MNRTIIECEWRSWEFHEQWNWAHIVCSSTNEFHVNWFFLSLASVHRFVVCASLKTLLRQANRVNEPWWQAFSRVLIAAYLWEEEKQKLKDRSQSKLALIIVSKFISKLSDAKKRAEHHRWRVESKLEYMCGENETHSTAARNKHEPTRWWWDRQRRRRSWGRGKTHTTRR